MAIGGVTVVPLGGGSGMSNIQKPMNYIVENMTDRDALILSPSAKGSTALVKDASDDSTVTSGWAMYSWEDGEWTKTTEGESLEVIELLLNYYDKDAVDALIAATSGGAGDYLLTSISAGNFIYPTTGGVNPFSNAANSANIMPDADNYSGRRDMLSTSATEPMQLPIFKIPAGISSLKFRFVYDPETATLWAGESVIWKMQHKKMTDNAAWSAVASKDLGTHIVPASGNAPQLYEVTKTLAELGLAAGDVVRMVVFVDPTSSLANDVAFDLCEIEAV